MNISEVAKKMDITPVTLRYYERIGLIPAISRKNGGVRKYREEDLIWIEFIKCMRSAGLSVESLVSYTSLFEKGDNSLEERKDILIKERNKLIIKKNEIESTLKRLNYKIKTYDEVLLKKEQKLINYKSI